MIITNEEECLKLAEKYKEKLKSEHYDDPTHVDYSHLPEKYAGKIEPNMLLNLLIDLDWFLINIANHIQNRTESNSKIEKLIDLLVANGKCSSETKDCRVYITLSSDSYTIKFFPDYITD